MLELPELPQAKRRKAGLPNLSIFNVLIHYNIDESQPDSCLDRSIYDNVIAFLVRRNETGRYSIMYSGR